MKQVHPVTWNKGCVKKKTPKPMLWKEGLKNFQLRKVKQNGPYLDMITAEVPVKKKLQYELPQMVEELLAAALHSASQGGYLTNAAVEKVRKKIGSGQVPCYEEDWAAFAYLYFALNAAKVTYAAKNLSRPRNKPDIRILDLGCGSGASTVGLLQSLIQQGWTANFHVWAVDKNRRQLDLYDKVVCPWFRSLRGQNTIRLVQRDALEALGEDNNWDIVVASYLLCELTPENRSELESYIGKWADVSPSQWLLVYQIPGMAESKYKISNLPPENFPEEREGFDKPLCRLFT